MSAGLSPTYSTSDVASCQSTWKDQQKMAQVLGLLRSTWQTKMDFLDSWFYVTHI